MVGVEFDVWANRSAADAGFVRFRQFEYADGSLSTTFVELDLRYPGVRNRDVTSGHNWAVFVNQVGEDAYNSVATVKCLAAGYRWNPYLADATNPNYKSDCSARNALRCEMGDLSGTSFVLLRSQHIVTRCVIGCRSTRLADAWHRAQSVCRRQPSVGRQLLDRLAQSGRVPQKRERR